MSRYVDTSFLIRPLEAIHFGRPRPFAAGEAHHASSEFPPSAYAFQGMVRSQLLRAARPAIDMNSSANRALWAELVGDADALPEGWQLTGPWPAREMAGQDGPYLEPWLPAPLFLLGGHQKAWRARAMGQNVHPALDDLGTVLLGRPDQVQIKPVAGWIAPANLAFALTGQGQWAAPAHGKLPPFVHREMRPGLALDGDTARHGMLYFLDSLRCHDPLGRRVGFYGRLQGRLDPRLPDDALVATLGAAGRKERPAAFEAVPRLAPTLESLLRGDHLPDSVADESSAFWLVSLSPVALQNPLRPVAGISGEVNVRVLGMLSAPPITLGGFRFAHGTSRPNRSYLPAGTCWLFRLEGGNAQSRGEVLRQLNHAHPLGDRAEAGFGFGYTLVGLGPQSEEE